MALGTTSSALNGLRRNRELDALASRRDVDVLIIGGGITGVGLALDAASRGLRTVLVERGDLAQGTSAYSSKLIHGGLRYLAKGQWAIAHESAAERHLLMTRIAPHLTRPLAQVMPLYAPDHVQRGAFIGAGYALGDALRRFVKTPTGLLPAPGFIDSKAVQAAMPVVRADGLRGGLRGWDGQLFDDARLVVAVARTAARYGAQILTRVSASDVDGGGATLLDAVTGQSMRIDSRAVISAAGVWAQAIDSEVKLRPSRGTHLVVATKRLGGADVSLTVPVPGSSSRFVFTVPAPHGRTYIGLTDVPADGLDDPQASDAEINMLLETINTVLQIPLTLDDVLSTFSGLRPLLAGTAADGETSDLSRSHAVITSSGGVLSVVGGKLTTYRRMSADGVDAAVRARALPVARNSATARIPLVGAWPRSAPPPDALPRFVRRYGAESPFVERRGGGPAAARGVTAQELMWAIQVEGALSVDDVLHRRTRLGLVDLDAVASEDAVRAAFEASHVEPLDTGVIPTRDGGHTTGVDRATRSE